MSAVCPVCSRPQDQGLMCHGCTSTLEYELGDVPAVVAELDTTLAKLGRLERGKAGLASQRSGYHLGASLAADYLTNTLTTWARDVAGGPEYWTGDYSVIYAAGILLGDIDTIRRHPAADELHDEVCSAIRQARAAADRPANRTTFPVGPCPEDTETGPCPGEVVAFIPTEDERPAWLRCQADGEHRWSSIQFYRVGERIRRRMDARRGKAGRREIPQAADRPARECPTGNARRPSDPVRNGLPRRAGWCAPMGRSNPGRTRRDRLGTR